MRSKHCRLSRELCSWKTVNGRIAMGRAKDRMGGKKKSLGERKTRETWYGAYKWVINTKMYVLVCATTKSTFLADDRMMQSLQRTGRLTAYCTRRGAVRLLCRVLHEIIYVLQTFALAMTLALTLPPILTSYSLTKWISILSLHKGARPQKFSFLCPTYTTSSLSVTDT